MTDAVVEFLLSKGILGLLCALLCVALAALWKTWRDDTAAWNCERTALYEQARKQELESLKTVVSMSNDLKDVLGDMKTSLALLLNKE